MIEAIYTGLWYGFAVGFAVLGFWLTGCLVLGVMDLIAYITGSNTGERTDERQRRSKDSGRKE